MIIEPKKRDVALVVDDSPETLRLLTDALDGAGMTVMVALDGAAAMRIVDQITPDIILLDAVMPGIDGFETCRRLKREAGLSNVPVIFMTGLAETEHIVRGLEAGGVDYVTKPIVIEEMQARIRVHLANARLTQIARAAHDVCGRHRRRRNYCRIISPPGLTMNWCCRIPCCSGLNRLKKAKPDRKPQPWRRFQTTSSYGCNTWVNLARTSSCCAWQRIPARICLQNSAANSD